MNPEVARIADLRAALDSLQSRWIANEHMPSLNGWQVLAYDAIEALRGALASEPPATGLDVERLGFDDLLAVGRALLEHYPPDTIVCSHSIKADIGARTVAAIRDLIDSIEAPK